MTVGGGDQEKYRNQKHLRREVAVKIAMAKSLFESGSFEEAQVRQEEVSRPDGGEEGSRETG
eukprot:763766-Hanusia_phi.AAC.2